MDIGLITNIITKKWLGSSTVEPRPMAEAMEKSLGKLGFQYSRPEEEIRQSIGEELYSFALRDPKINITFAWHQPVCPTYPYCIGLVECVFSTKARPVVWIEPVTSETKPVLIKIIKEWISTLPNNPWRYPEAIEKEITKVHGKGRVDIHHFGFQRKWAFWGVVEEPEGAQASMCM
jgi:hypothetical protein